MMIVLYGLATFVVVFGGGILGLLLGRILPEEYRSDATPEIVQTTTGFISLLAALALGLLVATAKSKFDDGRNAPKERSFVRSSKGLRCTATGRKRQDRPFRKQALNASVRPVPIATTTH
jgi:hypothetical protein